MHFVNREFQFPKELSEVLESFFQTSGLEKKSEILSQLWPLLAKERGQQDKQHYSNQDKFAKAYAAYYLPANLLKVSLILEEIQKFDICLGTDSSLRWLDIGCGPGTAFWGLAWWSNRSTTHSFSNLNYLGLEQSPSFLKIARELSNALCLKLNLKNSASFQQFQHSRNSSADKNLDAVFAGHRPHVLSLMNSVAELSPDLQKRKEWIDTCVKSLATLSKQDGQSRWLILIEPGSQASSRELLELRDWLRSNDEVKIWLPCLDSRVCGALQKEADWCHEEARCEFPEWMEKFGESAGLKKESLLFSYLVCSVGVHPTVSDRFPVHGRRVVSQRMQEKGLMQCFICTDSGKKKVRVLNSKQTPENLGFTEVIRGQVFKSIECDEKGSVLRFSESEISKELDATVFPPLE